MCTELILALIYFITVFFVNYFLFNIIKKNWNIFLNFLKIERILKLFKGTQKKALYCYLIRFQKKSPNIKILSQLNQLTNSSDILLLSSTYNFLLENLPNLNISSSISQNKEKEKRFFFSSKLYLNLLEKQYFNSL
jgi:hypothetical protein